MPQDIEAPPKPTTSTIYHSYIVRPGFKIDREMLDCEVRTAANCVAVPDYV